MHSLKKFFGVFLLLVAFLAVLIYKFQSISSGIAGTYNIFQSFSDRSFDYQKMRGLEAENIFLRSIVERIEQSSDSVEITTNLKHKIAPVYSNYPFNDKKRIIIGFGEKEGAKVKMPVFGSENTLIGKITSVKNHQSEVITIFDEKWISSVAVNDVNAILEGGLPPRLELVPTNAVISPGDLVKNSSPDFPINVIVGKIKETSQNEGNLWSIIEVDSIFNINSLRRVIIKTDFP